MPSKGNTNARGYGYHHKKIRKHWEPIVQAGRATCWRCGEPIAPDAQWDLGHNRDRTQYMGPEHQGCNRSTYGRERPRDGDAKPTRAW